MERRTQTPATEKLNPNICKGARIQQLRSDLARCVQNGQTIAAYYASLKKIWDELSNYISHPSCSCGQCKCGLDTQLIKQRYDKKTHQFLMGLDDVYVAERSNLLAIDPLPPLKRVYELLLNKEDCCSRRHLPEDLLPDILCRLPVKSLLRLRCVSKSWLCLVDDDYFARLHLNTFNNSSDETRLFVVQDGWYAKKGYVRCSDTFESIPKTTPLRLDSSWNIVSSVDGLILLKNGGGIFSDMRLWNPSIREFHDLPRLSSMTDIDIGLGYDPLAKDYKVVKLVFASVTSRLHSVAIYSVRAGSWKIISFKGNGSCSEWHWGSSIEGSVHLKGSLYFFATVEDDNLRVRDLVSFDLSNEVFSLVARKPDDSHFFTAKKLALIIDGGSLSVAVFTDLHRQVCVWMLDSETMNWKKLCSYPAHRTKLLYCLKKGDLLTFRFHEDEKFNEVGSYSPEKQQYKMLQQMRGADSIWIAHVSAFVESLILHKKSNMNV